MDELELDLYIKRLKEKYKYSSELLAFLRRLIPVLLTYYGIDKKNQILDALLNCEIHIQGENENSQDFLNSYFQMDKSWDLPDMASAFETTEISLNDKALIFKRIIYIKTVFYHNYRAFDWNDEEKLSDIIHEICHLIKEYGKFKFEDGQLVSSSGLMKDYYEFDAKTGTFNLTRKENEGIEEALNSIDEKEVLSIMLGKKCDFYSYIGMAKTMEKLLEHRELAQVFRISQFSGGTEWKDFLGFDVAAELSKNFDDWVHILQKPFRELRDSKHNYMQILQAVMEKIGQLSLIIQPRRKNVIF